MTRETFLTVVGSGPVLQADAICVLSGDGTSRCDVALELFRQQGASRILVIGSLDNPPFSLVAKRLEAYLLGKGVAPSAIVRLDEGTNTREEADAIVQYAKQQKWGRLIVVTSAFHAARAYLTFVQSLTDAQAEKETQVLVVPTSQSKWTETPKGETQNRLSLLRDEFRRIQEYQEKGDVASYDAGLDYLLFWEQKAA